MKDCAKYMARPVTCIVVGLAMAGSAQAQAPVIASFGENGQLGCTNLAASTMASVEWASQVTGPWQTNWAALSAIAASPSGTISASVPMFYRVRGIGRTAPTVVTSNATSIVGSLATLNASATPNGASATGWFRYSASNPGSPSDSFGIRAPASSGTDLGSGLADISFAQDISVTPSRSPTTYYYWGVASNSEGLTCGSIHSFATTVLPPTAATSNATGIAGTTATLNGSGNPKGLTATGWFRYSTTNPGVTNDTSGTRVPASGGTALGAGGSSQAYAQALSGLSTGTTYYYWAVVSNLSSAAFGSIMSFTTPSAPSVVTSNIIPGYAGTDATLVGSASPNRSATTAWFRYATTGSAPGVGNDTFGTRVPSSGGFALGAGSTNVVFSQYVTGFAVPPTYYYYCAISSNSEGISYGAMTFFGMPPPY